MNYRRFFEEAIDQLHAERRYRIFADLERIVGRFPKALWRANGRAQALSDAEATIDVEARRAKMEKVEKILQDAAIMVQPLWRPVYTMTSSKVHGYSAHPSRQMQLTKVWIDS